MSELDNGRQITFNGRPGYRRVKIYGSTIHRGLLFTAAAHKAVTTYTLGFNFVPENVDFKHSVF
jgi:hypothetical protein